jgi:hypothetical protein
LKHFLYALFCSVGLATASLWVNWGILLPLAFHLHYQVNAPYIFAYAVYMCVPLAIIAGAIVGLKLSFLPSTQLKLHAIVIASTLLTMIILQTYFFARVLRMPP